jgi:tellurite resistance-related uncharacterized protein
METTIAGLHQDAEGDWVADLACGHSQHMRHRPPWQRREWVTTPEGRASRLGVALDCPLCDRIRIPPDAREFQRTDTFTDQTLPAGLRANHRTKPGIWARIVVEAGSADFHVRGRVHTLAPGEAGIVEPEVLHHIVPGAGMMLHVEFYRGSERRAG